MSKATDKAATAKADAEAKEAAELQDTENAQAEDAANTTTDDPTSTGPGMFKNPLGKTGGKPPTPTPVDSTTGTRDHSKFTPIQGGTWLNLVSGKVHRTVAMTRPVFKHNGEPEWDQETGEQKMEEIPVAEREIGGEVGPFTFHAVPLDKGLGDPIPGTLQPYENPAQFPTDFTCSKVRQLLGRYVPTISVIRVLGDPGNPVNKDDRVRFVLINSEITNPKEATVEPGQWAMDYMNDPTNFEGRVKSWLKAENLLF